MLTVHSDNIGLHHQTTNPRYVPKPVEWSEGVIPFIKVIHMPQRVASCVLCMLHFWSYRGLTRSVGASHGMRSRSKVPQVSPPHLQALQIVEEVEMVLSPVRRACLSWSFVVVSWSLHMLEVSLCLFGLHRWNFCLTV
jgi:hypothetical protein